MRFSPARPASFFRGIFILVFVSLLSVSFLYAPTYAQVQIQPGQSTEGWQEDSEVTTVGKTAVRARDFLNWTLDPDNTKWVFLSQDRSINQLAPFWVIVRDIAYALTVVVVLFSAFLIIVTRGRSINARRQIIIIAGVLLLITLSFSIIQGVYWFADTVQNFFLRRGDSYISARDLLSVGFDYTLTGYRLQPTNPTYEESAKVSLFLVKATAVTYYVMAGMLLLRKIILWFFIILSPLWVLLLPFPLIRNTAKIWLGEFFRWLFYGLLFSVLLRGLVEMWQHGGIPLNFQTDTGEVVYPTAISILLGGPGVAVAQENSVNNVNTFASYAIALLMLWVVILLPFLLLKIFRDAITGFFKEDNLLFQKAIGSLYPFLGRPPPGVPTPVTPPPPSGEGLAREMALRRPANMAREITIQAQVANIESLPQVKTTDIVKYAGLSVPKLADLARMEMQRDTLTRNQMMLRNIASPTNISSMHERSRFSSIQQELLARSSRGDTAATTILAAAESARSGKPVPVIVGQRVSAARPGTPLTAAKPLLMPTVNRIQTVGIDDYEDVKKMWEENYRSGDIPISDKVKSRLQWLQQDIEKLQTVVELISSQEEEKKKQGLEELAIILPFLLLGGFSDQETTIYLKAKLEAAKKVLTELEQKEKEEDKVLVEEKKEEQKEKTMQAAVPIEESNAQEAKPAAPVAQNDNTTENQDKTPQGEGNKGL